MAPNNGILEQSNTFPCLHCILLLLWGQVEVGSRALPAHECSHGHGHGHGALSLSILDRVWSFLGRCRQGQPLRANCCGRARCGSANECVLMAAIKTPPLPPPVMSQVPLTADGDKRPQQPAPMPSSLPRVSRRHACRLFSLPWLVALAWLRSRLLFSFLPLPTSERQMGWLVRVEF